MSALRMWPVGRVMWSHGVAAATIAAFACIAPNVCSAQDAKPEAAPAPAATDASRYGPTHSAPGATEYFIDLKDGQTVPTKVTVHFGLRGMGVAPAGSDRPNSGHHHLLIDTELPPLNKPIPNDFNHLHFGAGQTEADVELTPGDHTLQLLLGDKNHIPFDPPIASDRIKVHVTDAPVPEASAAAPPAAAPADSGPPKRHPSPPGAREYIVAPSNGAVVPTTFTVRFGLIGMGVAPAGLNKAYTGHHHLIVDAPLPPMDQPIPNDFNHYHYGLGQTEAQVTLPPGPHTLQLLLGDANHIPHEPPVFSEKIKIYVGTPGGGSRRHYYRHHHR